MDSTRVLAAVLPVLPPARRRTVGVLAVAAQETSAFLRAPGSYGSSAPLAAPALAPAMKTATAIKPAAAPSQPGTNRNDVQGPPSRGTPV